MSLLSSFIRNQLLKGLEEEFVSHESDIQESILEQIEAFASECMEWVNSKLNGEAGVEQSKGEKE
jgi:hypothetical protein